MQLTEQELQMIRFALRYVISNLDDVVELTTSADERMWPEKRIEELIDKLNAGAATGHGWIATPCFSKHKQKTGAATSRPGHDAQPNPTLL